jgi:centromere/kinetochore protein ZW10
MALEGHLGQVLVDFSRDGTFPEEESVSAAYMEGSVLPEALAVLSNAKSELEVAAILSDILRSCY